MMRLIPIVCALLSAAVAQELPKIVPRIVYPGERFSESFWSHAPHVLILQVQKVEYRGPGIQVSPPTSDIGGLNMNLLEVTARVENVISGKALPNTIKFYCFADTGRFVAYGYRFNPGSRHIVFLREDAGVLRTMVDLSQMQVELLTGFHEQAVVRSQKNSIAYVLFTPGKGTDVVRFSDTLGSHLNEEYWLTPTSYLLSLIHRLQSYPDTRIRRAACRVLFYDYRLQDPCADALKSDPDPNARKLASDLLKHAQADEADLLRDLAKDPVGYSSIDDSRDFKGALARFTTDQRPRIHKRACELLEVMFQADKFVNCAGESGAARK
jgi:hypothetical protein